jgi:Zn-dependent oligopeptidase
MSGVRIVFHEFGHALHALLSDVRFSWLSGTRVARDFAEFPSQLFENWALQPKVLAQHARHLVTGEPIGSEMVKQLRTSLKLNERLLAISPASNRSAIGAATDGHWESQWSSVRRRWAVAKE